MTARPFAIALAAAFLSAGCTGEAWMVGEGEPGGAGGGGESGELPACDVAAFPDRKLDAIAAQFDAQVYPLLTRAEGGCASCHAVGSGRLFLVTGDGVETFHKARAGGYFKLQPGSLVDRLESQEISAKMPRGMPSWPVAEVARVAEIACQVKALDAQNPIPSDEQFPPELLAPYGGPPLTSYDNTFVSYLQLKGRVKAVFNDGWVRNGVDKFQQNIGLFGGVDFTSHFVEARVATPEFLLGLDALAPDVCQQAVANKTGPFAGTDPTAPVIDQVAATTQVFEAEAMPVKTSGSAAAGGWNLSSNGNVATPVTFSATGSYTFTARAYGQQGGPDPASMDLIIDSAVVKTFAVTATAYADHVFTANVTGGQHTVALAFTNDFYDATVTPVQDRNLVIDKLTIVGPAGAGTGTTRATAAKAVVNTLYTKMLYRSATSAEQDAAYKLLTDLVAIGGTTADSWSGVCEALVRHPDFLFTLPPHHEVATGAEKKKLLLVKLAQDLLSRPPTQAELDGFSGGAQSYAQLLDGYLASTEFRDYYFYKMRIRTESEGNPVTDEPARLWTYLAINGAPFNELLTGDYSVDAAWAKQARPAYHGKTGLLTMKGFIQNKQGLPHYNYSARVITDFMGTIFEVPAEVFDQRGTATAASTVDPKSICYSCHQVLTPLAHQRLRWDDNGTYRTNDPVTGAEIDDSDRGMVATYPYKGKGLEAFATQASKKEPFVRRTLQAQYNLLYGRDMRWDKDERDTYKQLWDLTASSNGNLKAVLKAIAQTPGYTRGTAL